MDISPQMFISRFHEVVPPQHFWVGIVKAPVFALVVAMVGCRQGMLVEGDVVSLGRRTTSAVVQAIFLVIALDADVCRPLLHAERMSFDTAPADRTAAPAGADDVIIRVRGLTNRFGDKTVHEDLDLDVKRGEVLGVIGGSGTGRSVLLRSIVGLHAQRRTRSKCSARSSAIFRVRSELRSSAAGASCSRMARFSRR